MDSVFGDILLIQEILHQLVGSLSHYLQGLYIPGGAGFLPSTAVNYREKITSLQFLKQNFGQSCQVFPDCFYVQRGC